MGQIKVREIVIDYVKTAYQIRHPSWCIFTRQFSMVGQTQEILNAIFKKKYK